MNGTSWPRCMVIDWPEGYTPAEYRRIVEEAAQDTVKRARTTLGWALQVEWRGRSLVMLNEQGAVIGETIFPAGEG